MLLGIAGAAVGLAIAWVGLQGAGALIPGQFQTLGLEAGINFRVLGWSLLLAIVCGLLVGVLPALQATRTDPHESLKADARTGGSRGGRRVRHVLVVAELALSVVLLLGAGLLMRSFLNLQRVDRGFDPSGVLTMRLTLPRERYPGDAAGAFFDQLSERLAALPGVRAVAAASQFPPSGTFTTQFALEGAPASGQTMPTALVTVASPGYFDTLRVPLRAGRSISPSDRLDTPRVAMINQAFAARYLAGVDPIGRRLSLGSADRSGPLLTIVGVVSDYRNNGATRAVRPEIYTPVRQQTAWNQLFVLVRTDASPAGTAALGAPDRVGARSRTTGLHDSNARRGARHVIVSATDLGRAPDHLRGLWRWCWRRSASTASCRTPSPPARRRWVCAWPSAHSGAT